MHLFIQTRRRHEAIQANDVVRRARAGVDGLDERRVRSGARHREALEQAAGRQVLQGVGRHQRASEHPYTRLKINDLGTVVGHIQSGAPGVADLPVVWWQGQVVALNKVAKLPANMVLTDIKAINNRNQLLVWAEDKTKPRNGRFMLLTLQ
jgi:hypothetical protein